MRFRVEPSAAAGFEQVASQVVQVLQGRPGCGSVELGQNLDDPELWALTSTWVDVGSYRRGLGGNDMKLLLMQLWAYSIDEPSAYADPADVGPNIPRGTG